MFNSYCIPLYTIAYIYTSAKRVYGVGMTYEVALLGLFSGLDDATLCELYGSEEQCRQALIRLRWGQGWICARCGHRRHAVLRQRRVLQCNICKQQVSLTAGTVFENSKLPLAAWFSAIHQLSRTRGRATSTELARRLGLRQGTAWLMKRKLMHTYTFNLSRKLTNYIPAGGGHYVKVNCSMPIFTRSEE